jgi:hypothetical protein
MKWFSEGSLAYDMTVWCAHADPRTEYADRDGVHNRTLVTKSYIHRRASDQSQVGEWPAIVRPHRFFWDLEESGRHGQCAWKMGPARRLANDRDKRRGEENPEIPDDNPMASEYFDAMRAVFNEAQILSDEDLPMLTSDVFGPWAEIDNRSGGADVDTPAALGDFKFRFTDPEGKQAEDALSGAIAAGISADNPVLKWIMDPESFSTSGLDGSTMDQVAGIYANKIAGFSVPSNHGKPIGFVPMSLLASPRGVRNAMLPFRAFKAFRIQDVSDLEFCNGSAHVSLWDRYPRDPNNNNGGDYPAVSEAYIKAYGHLSVIGHLRLAAYLQKQQVRTSLGQSRILVRGGLDGEEEMTEEVQLIARR